MSNEHQGWIMEDILYPFGLGLICGTVSYFVYDRYGVQGLIPVWLISAWLIRRILYPVALITAVIVILLLTFKGDILIAPLFANTILGK